MFVVLFYAGNIVVGRAINELPPLTITFFRLLIAFLVLLPIGLRSVWRHHLIFRRHRTPLVIMTLSGIALFQTLLYSALQFTTASNVAVLETAIPAVTALLSILWLKEHLGAVQWAGIILSLFGAVWVVLDGNVLQIAAADWNTGDLIMGGAIICWAVYSVAVKQYMHLFPSYGALFVMSGIALAVLLPFVLMEWAFIGFPSALLTGSLEYIVGLVYLGVFPSFIALLLYNRAIELLTAAQASVFLNFLPVATMAGAYFWLGEAITHAQILGAALVILGVILTARQG